LSTCIQLKEDSRLTTAKSAGEQIIAADASCASSSARFAIHKKTILKNKKEISYHCLCWGKDKAKRAPSIGAVRRG
jgi:hypothetical protein